MSAEQDLIDELIQQVLATAEIDCTLDLSDAVAQDIYPLARRIDKLRKAQPNTNE